MPALPSHPIGRPRDAAADARIIDATLDLIGAGETIESLSIVGVAARAGVGRNTIYRRWPTKQALLLDVLAAVHPPPLLESDFGDLSQRLVASVETIYRRARDPRVARLLRCLVAESDRHPELRDAYLDTVTRPRRAAVRAALRRGIDEGVLRSDLDLDTAMRILLGPALFHSFADIGDDSATDTDPRILAERLVATALRGLAN